MEVALLVEPSLLFFNGSQKSFRLWKIQGLDLGRWQCLLPSLRSLHFYPVHLSGDLASLLNVVNLLLPLESVFKEFYTLRL